MKETKNVSKAIIYEGNDRILLSESNLRSGFPVIVLVKFTSKVNIVLSLQERLKVTTKLSSVFLANNDGIYKFQYMLSSETH